MIKYYTLNPDNSIATSADFKFSEYCLETTREIVHCEWNGKMYFADEMPEIPPQEISRRRQSEIAAKLDELDRQSTRPLRAIIQGKGTDFDTRKLAAIETEVELLRDELLWLQQEESKSS